MQREDLIPQGLAVDEERLLPQDAPDWELLHLGEAAMLLQNVKYARDAFRLLAVAVWAAVGHHLVGVHIADLVRALSQSGGHGRGARTSWDRGDLEDGPRQGAGRSIHVHTVVGCRITVGQRHCLTWAGT